MSYLGEVQSAHGLLHKFDIGLEDGHYGEVLAKSQQPWYKEGSDVDYTVTGEYKGTPKLKLGKPEFTGKPFGGGKPAPVAHAASASARAPINESGPILGMCFKMAVDHYRAKGGDELDTTAKAEIIKATLFFKSCYETLQNFKPIPKEANEDAPF